MLISVLNCSRSYNHEIHNYGYNLFILKNLKLNLNKEQYSLKVQTETKGNKHIEAIVSYQFLLALSYKRYTASVGYYTTSESHILNLF